MFYYVCFLCFFIFYVRVGWQPTNKMTDIPEQTKPHLTVVIILCFIRFFNRGFRVALVGYPTDNDNSTCDFFFLFYDSGIFFNINSRELPWGEGSSTQWRIHGFVPGRPISGKSRSNIYEGKKKNLNIKPVDTILWIFQPSSVKYPSRSLPQTHRPLRAPSSSAVRERTHIISVHMSFVVGEFFILQ